MTETQGFTGAMDTSFRVHDGDVLAFRLDGNEFFAEVKNDTLTGYLDLTRREPTEEGDTT